MRRTFRRHIRKTLDQNVPPVLQEANFAFDKGEYGRAAELFETIAQTADARGGPRAPTFHLQAGRSRVLAGQTRLGLPSLKRGLELLAQRGQLQKLHRSGEQVIADLNARGLHTEAADMESWLRKLAHPLPSYEIQSPLTARVAFPTHCPACGATVKPDEVEWLDDVTAECAYCGNVLKESG